LCSSYDDDTIAYYLNNRDRTFGSRVVVATTADGATGVEAADMDNDGDIDIISCSYNDGKIAWYERYADGTYSSEQVLTYAAHGAKGIYIADLNNDAHKDIIYAASLTNTIGWIKNYGDRSFSSDMIISTVATGATAVFAAYMDSDDLIDVLSASRDDNVTAWYQNYGNDQFGDRQIIDSSSGGGTIYAVDLDADGDFDVIGSGYSSDEITWYQNLLSLNCSVGTSNYFVPQFESSKSGVTNSKITIAVKFSNAALSVNPSFDGASDCAMTYTYMNRASATNSRSCSASVVGVLEGLDINSLRQCGFTLQSSSSTGTTSYQTRFKLQVVEQASIMRNMTFNRTMEYAMLLQVQFASSVNANSSSVYVYGQGTGEVIVTSITLDSQTKDAVVILTTSIQYPYRLSDLSYDATNPRNGYNVNPSIFPLTNCTVAVNTSCIQTWQISFDAIDPCGETDDRATSFSVPDWQISFSIACDERRINCTGTPTGFVYASFATQSPNYCPNMIATITPTLTLNTYDGINLIPQSAFVLGTKSYFRALLDSPVNVDKIRITKVQMTSGNPDGVSVLYEHNYDSN